MAKYSITHDCGHTETHNIVGTNVHGERDRKVAWLSGQVCSDCYRATQDKARAAATEAAAAATTDLPGLTGSPKQIAWATTIRADAKAAIDAAVAGKELSEAQRSALAALYAQPAAWWIDNRTNADFAVAWLREASKIAARG